MTVFTSIRTQSLRLARSGALAGLLYGAMLAAPAQAAEAEVKIKGEISGATLKMYFEPQTLTVPAGTTVTWVNEDHGVHRVQFADSTSPSLPAHKRGKPAAAYSLSFPQPGSYPYNCAVHGEKMQGVIVVE